MVRLLMRLPSEPSSRFIQHRKPSTYPAPVVWEEDENEPAEKTIVTSKTPSSMPAPATSGTAYLIVISGNEMGRRLSLGSSSIEAGRAMGCDFSIAHESVSRRHARIFWTGTAYRVRDLGSTNGTFVNDEPVRERELQEGDRIRIGETVLKLVVSGSLEASYHEQIYRLVTHDELTQLFNRRYFEEAISREVGRSQRYRRQLGLVILDIDHFKALNDAHGHLAGDSVLRELAKTVKQNVRKQDVLARVGGEELALLAPESGGAEVFLIAEKIRRIVEEARFSFGKLSLWATISLGCASLREMDDSAALYRRADEALYIAKESGRNRVAFG